MVAVIVEVAVLVVLGVVLVVLGVVLVVVGVAAAAARGGCSMRRMWRFGCGWTPNGSPEASICAR